MKQSMTICILMLTVFFLQISQAQFQAGAFLGFKSYGLKAAGTVTSGGNRQVTPVQDAGGTVFNFGGFGGYTAISEGVYNLDLQLKASYSSIGFLERGYNNIAGAGQFAAQGASGAGTSIFEFDLLGLNRFTFRKFKIIEPYAGIGMSFNIYSTSDLTVSPQGQQSITRTGNSEFKLGLIITYGTLIRVSPGIAPYIQFSHLLGFGSTTQLTNDTQYTYIVNDVPGYFALSAGIRFDL
ncbi:MAG: hypothetical protein ABSB78_04325 [Bacteroidota bacterium]